MAGGWVRWRVDSQGRRTAQIQRRDPDTRRIQSRALGEVSEAVALAQLDMLCGDDPPARPEETSARVALARFLSHWRTVRRRKKDTLAYYRKRLGCVFAFLSQRAPMRRWQRKHLEAFVRAHPEWSPRTVQMHVVACGTFVKWARRARLSVPDFVDGMDVPRVVRKEKEAFAAGEVVRVLAAARRRTRLPVALAFWAGMSVGDVRALGWPNVHLDPEPGFLVGRRSKTNAPFRVPLAKPLRALLLAVPPRRRRGPLCPGFPADDATATKALRRLYGAAEVPTEGGYKRLRHTFSTLMQEAGVDYATVEDLMGHKSGPSTTRVYTHSDDRRRKDAIRRLERLMGRAARTE